MTTLDLDFVRAQFPAFAHPEMGQWAHLENAGGSYCPSQVVDLLADLFAHAKCQPNWDFGPSVVATEAMDRSRAVMAELFAADEGEIHFGPSTSQNTYVLAKAMRPMWDDGDEIIVTGQDHEANQGAWRRLADTGIVVKEWAVDPESGLLNPTDLDELITARTRLLAVTHASNIAATINPVRALADRVHAVGGHIVVDGVSYAPHGLPDVAALTGSTAAPPRSCPQAKKKKLSAEEKAAKAAEKAAKEKAEGSVERLALEAEWRSLYPVAWADFERFMLGWNPHHKKLTAYSERMTQRAIELVSDEGS